MNAKPTKKEKENNVVAKLRNLTAMIWRNSVKPFSLDKVMVFISAYLYWACFDAFEFLLVLDGCQLHICFTLDLFRLMKMQ